MFNSNARPVIADALPHFKDRKLHTLIERGKPTMSMPAQMSTPIEVAAHG